MPYTLIDHTETASNIRTITQTASRKSFHLSDVLSLSSGLRLTREGSAAIHRLIGYVMEMEPCAHTTATQGVTAKNCVEEQLRFLKDVDIALLANMRKSNPSQMDVYMGMWLEMQELKYGIEHFIMPLRLWQKQQGSYRLSAIS